MMNAAEAKAKTDELNQKYDDIQLADIQKNVEKAIANRKYACRISTEPSTNLKKRLTDLGYKVSSYSDQRDGGPTEYTISWT